MHSTPWRKELPPNGSPPPCSHQGRMGAGKEEEDEGISLVQNQGHPQGDDLGRGGRVGEDLRRKAVNGRAGKELGDKAV